MDEKTRKNAIVAWPLFKAIAEGKSLECRPNDVFGPYVWKPVENRDGHVDIDPDRYTYRIKEDPLDALDRIVKDSLRAAWAAQGQPGLTQITNTTRAELRALFKEYEKRED